MKKASLLSSCLLVAGLSMSANSAFAHHGQEYLVSACDKTGENTAQLVITDVHNYQYDQKFQKAVSDAFEELMKDHTAQDSEQGTRAFVGNLINAVGTALDKYAQDTGREIYLDIHQPLPEQGGPTVPGCK